MSAASGPVFLVGSMGCGTTVMRLILDSHESLAIAQETTFMRTVLAHKYVPFWKFGGVWYKRLGWSQAELDEELRQFYGRLFERFAAQQGKRRWGDKSPHHVWHMRAMAELWPDASFVGMVRHPGAAASSIHNRFHFAWDYSVKHWRRFTMRMLLSGIELGERFVLCRYEDVVGDPEPLLRDLLHWLGEPWSPAVLEHHAVQTRRGAPAVVEGHTRVADPLDPSRIAKWATGVEPEGRRVLRRETAALARYFGYDLDDPKALHPIPGSAGPQGRLVTGIDLARRRRDFPEVDWARRPKPSLANRSLTPKALKEELAKAREEGARSAGASPPRAASRRLPARSLARRAARRLPASLQRRLPVAAAWRLAIPPTRRSRLRCSRLRRWTHAIQPARPGAGRNRRQAARSGAADALATAVQATGLGITIRGRLAGPVAGTAALLRLRDGSEEVRLPVDENADGRGFSFTLAPPGSPGGPALREGVWDLYVEQRAEGGARRVRLVDERGRNESSTYLTPVVAGPAAYVQPYATPDGDISVRVRRANPHVEVIAVRVADGCISVRGRVHRARTAGAAEFVLRAGDREATVPAIVSDAVTADIDASAVVAALADGGRDVVASAKLRLAGEQDELPLTGWLDDIRDKQTVVLYPALSVEAVEAVWSMRPEWDADNTLGVRIEPSQRDPVEEQQTGRSR